MPQVEGGYFSLDGGPDSVYNTTTEPTTPNTIFESVKRAIGQVISSGPQDQKLINTKGDQPFIISSRDREKTSRASTNNRMPSAPSRTAEEARLLGGMPVDPMDDIELRSVQLQFPNSRGSIEGTCDLRRVPTDKGDILVAIQGDTSKPAILTYHDLGLNYTTSFAGFFSYPSMRGLLENFCVYHVTAPGQEEGAPTLPEDYVYPTMDELAAQVSFVLTHFALKNVIGFGVGAGANILCRFAINNPDKMGALCLINCVSTAAGWIEWGYQTFNARSLRTKGMTQGVVDYLMWHHFGRNPEERNHDLFQMYKSHFERNVNPTNLAMMINSYIHRTDLNIARTPSGSPQTSATTIKMPVINITGSLSPHVDDTVTFNGRLDPTNSSWMKISDCAMVLEEQPAKLSEAFRLFLQGEGYAHMRTIIPSSIMTRTRKIIKSSTSTTTTTTITNSNSTTNFILKNHLPTTTNNIGLGIASSQLYQQQSSPNKQQQSTIEQQQNIMRLQQIQNSLNNNQITNNNDNNGNDEITESTNVFSTNRSKNNTGAIRITENPLPETVAC